MSTYRRVATDPDDPLDDQDPYLRQRHPPSSSHSSRWTSQRFVYSAAMVMLALVAATIVGLREERYFRTAHGRNQARVVVEFVRELQLARIKDNGPSLHVNYTLPDSNELPPWPGFSFAMQACPDPHFFTRPEACDLLKSYGSLYIAGDSFMRHVRDALLLLLTDDLSGAIGRAEAKAACRGEHLFNDRDLKNFSNTTPCRTGIYVTLDRLSSSLCDGEMPRGSLSSAYSDFPTTHFLSFLSSAPDAVRGRSPVLFYAGGVHFNYNITRTKLNYVQPIAELNRLFGPRLVPVWHGNHAPGDNIAAHYYRTQGRESVKKYNQDVEDLLRQFGSEAPATEGAFRMLHFYNATEGGESAIPFFLLSLEAASADTRFIPESFDGQHYSYQVNMEKVHTFLTYLDILWQEAVEAGGLDTQ
ncbi:hypothetical protein JCM10049v2_007310 [Rhodotorula toruloides]